MQRLACVLLEGRIIQGENKLSFIKILHPTYFKVLVAGTKTIAGYDQMNSTFSSASLALQVSTTMKIALDAVKLIEIQKLDYCQKAISNY